MASKINKTGLSGTKLPKSSPGVPKLSPIMTRYEHFSNSNTSSERRSPKVPTPPERSRSTRSVSGLSELKPRLIQLKEDLRKANELIATLEIEKAKALDELEQVREEAFEKLCEAQKLAEANFEIEKFKAVEAGVEAFHRKEEELKKELETVKSQHASDSAVLLLVTRELEKVNQELAAANDAKSKLLSQTEDATKKVKGMVGLKNLLESTRKKETISNKEIVVLKSKLEKARWFETEVKERENIIEKLNDEIEVLKTDNSYANCYAEQWCNKAIAFEKQLEKAKLIERSASVSVIGLANKLKGSKEELSKLKTELETVKEEKSEILSELKRWREEEEKSEEAMQSLASALHQARSESRELKEKLLSLGGGDYEAQVEGLKLVIKETNEKYEKLLHEAEQTKKLFEISVLDWEVREAGLVNHVKKFDEEMNRLGNLVKRSKEEADGALEKESEMRDDLKEVEDEVSYLQDTLREARAEGLKLNAKMLDKETEFQSVVHENDLLRVKQDDSLKKIEELTKLLEEALAVKDDGESEKDYDLLEFEKEDSQDGDDDTVEVEYTEKKEEPEQEVEDSPEDHEKENKKKTLFGFGKVGSLLKKK